MSDALELFITRRSLNPKSLPVLCQSLAQVNSIAKDGSDNLHKSSSRRSVRYWAAGKEMPSLPNNRAAAAQAGEEPRACVQLH
jgi:hypothetical protein